MTRSASSPKGIVKRNKIRTVNDVVGAHPICSATAIGECIGGKISRAEAVNTRDEIRAVNNFVTASGCALSFPPDDLEINKKTPEGTVAFRGVSYYEGSQRGRAGPQQSAVVASHLARQVLLSVSANRNRGRSGRRGGLDGLGLEVGLDSQIKLRISVLHFLD